MARRTGRLLLALLALVAVTVIGGFGEGIHAEDRYSFPVGFDPALLVWEERHWDGSLAVDVGIHPGFPVGSPERTAFYDAPILAVTSGRAIRLDNPRGGIAVILHGDDGYTYYFAHLATSSVDEPRTVERGEPLGTVGRTGTWAQYLEPHLHLSIATGHQTGTDWVADVPASDWLRWTFGFNALPIGTEAYRTDEPSGLPFFGRPRVVKRFEEALAENLLLAGVTVAAGEEGASSASLPVRAPLAGAVRVHTDTPLGMRLQITNARTGYTVIISGEIEPVVSERVVYAGQVLGFASGSLHYMVFLDGTPVDPEAR